MTHLPTLRECFHYNDWARDKVLAAAQGLSAADLERPVAMGWGSLWDTLRHLYGAERYWFMRWQGEEKTPFPAARTFQGPDGLWAAGRAIAEARDALLATLGEADLEQAIPLPDELARPTWPLRLMLLHVCNHGVHHRAQALNMLRHLGRKPPGLDYLFMRLERPTVALSAAVGEALRQEGFDVGTTAAPTSVDGETLRTWFRYGDWATERVLRAAADLDDAALDRPFEIGLGRLRVTVAHIHDVERWWCKNWKGQRELPKLPDTTSMAELRAAWAETAAQRSAYVAALADEDLQRVVGACVRRDLRLDFRLGETMLELCAHGTHHRAQALNMLRQLGAATPGLDFYNWFCDEGRTEVQP